MESFNKASLNTLLKKHEQEKGSLVSFLQDIQGKFGYLPRHALQHVSSSLEIPLSKLFSIATFYNSFNLEPQGRNTLSVCLGTACHVKSGDDILRMLGRNLGLDSSEGTTSDQEFTLKKVRCLGCCSMAPVVKLNDDIQGCMTQTKTSNLLKKYNKNRK